MKTSRIALLALVIASAFAFSSARAESPSPVDQFAQAGSLSVSAAGPYVERGTLQVQVAAKLGKPRAVLTDGTWLYDGFSSPDRSVTGTLVVRFSDRAVSELTLVSPAVKTQMMANLGQTPAKTVVHLDAEPSKNTRSVAVGE